MKVTVSFGPELGAAVRDAISRADRQLIDMLDDIGVRGEETARGLAPSHTGRFADSITHEVTGDAVSIGSKSRLAHIVESGRGPGKMPPPPLIASIFSVSDDEAFLIARRIGRTGTSGSKVFELTRKQMEADVRDLARKLTEQIAGLSLAGAGSAPLTYTTKSGKTRTASAAQIANWTRGAA